LRAPRWIIGNAKNDMAYRLVFELGDRIERRLLAPGEPVLGSAPECEVTVAHPSVSRRHARLVVSAEGVSLADLGSRNGTLVDGRRLDREPIPVLPGCRLQFGTVPATLEEVAAADLEAAVTLPPARRVGAVAPGEVPLVESHLGPSTTASIGSLRDLVVDELPRLVELLAARAAPIRMGQAVGQALFTCLPCRSVTLQGAGGEGSVLFTATRTPVTEDERDSCGIRAVAGSGLLEVVLAHPSQAAAYAPVVTALARLVATAEASSRRPQVATERLEEASLPEPATVVPEVRRIYEQARRVARGDVSVLIEGESGTGKEVLARFLHAASPRGNAAFVALNCAALPRDLLEAELFGIEEKVATGVAARPGKFELADGGTLFLDEIGDMAPETQARILRVLQEGEVHRLGGLRPRPARVRVLAATNRDVAALIASGGFRADLYHRIAGWCVTLPPLRRRRADVANLAARFLADESARLGIPVGGISRGALDALESYAWPGNIRELQREMARCALFLEPGQLVESSHLAPAIRDAPSDGAGGADPPGTLRERLEAVERREIRAAIAECGGDVTAAARRLGLGRSTLYRRMVELAVERPES
jgi:DNA-binding NtrC family response regulator